MKMFLEMEIKGETFKLTIDEAKSLYRQLGILFDKTPQVTPRLEQRWREYNNRHLGEDKNNL